MEERIKKITVKNKNTEGEVQEIQKGRCDESFFEDT